MPLLTFNHYYIANSDGAEYRGKEKNGRNQLITERDVALRYIFSPEENKGRSDKVSQA